MTLKNLLKDALNKGQLKYVPSSFDIIGNKDKAVAIIEIPEQLKSKARIIARALMEQHKNVSSVLLKASERKGTYRLRRLKLICGSRNTEVVHAESGCRFLLDPKKVYFSPREGTERIRVATSVGNRETVMVFFAGIGPFPIVIAKKSKPKKIIGIEINPDAIRYFRKNLKLNNVQDIEIIAGDAKEKAAQFYGMCDRVIMPLPESAADYLSYAIKCLKKSGVIHLYCFSEEGTKNKQINHISAICKGLKRRCSIFAVNKVLPYGPRICKYRLDIKVSA